MSSSPKHTISDAFRHIRELMRCITVLEARIAELERQNEEYEWDEENNE